MRAMLVVRGDSGTVREINASKADDYFARRNAANEAAFCFAEVFWYGPTSPRRSWSGWRGRFSPAATSGPAMTWPRENPASLRPFPDSGKKNATRMHYNS
jgi:hypothetical protein